MPYFIGHVGDEMAVRREPCVALDKRPGQQRSRSVAGPAGSIQTSLDRILSSNAFTRIQRPSRDQSVGSHMNVGHRTVASSRVPSAAAIVTRGDRNPPAT